MPSRMSGNKSPASPPSDAGSSTSRIQRNLAEKQRRDKLNGFIGELATIVPMVSMAPKRLDKTSVLRLSAAHLRISQSLLSNTRKKTKNFRWCPSFFTSQQIREILESVDGFLLVTTSNGKVMYVSQSVEKFLGHQNIEMIGHTIFSFVHPSDLDSVRSQFEALADTVEQNNGNGSQSVRCSFYCRLRERSQPRSEVLTYQFVHFGGYMTSLYAEDIDGDKSSKASTSFPLNIVLKAFIRVVHSNPYNELSLIDATEDEYVTRHSPTGSIIFSDHRISTITGHLPHEVFGMSAYEYIVQKDIPIALFAHKLMFSSRGTGVIVYRLRTRNQGYVYLKSTGYLHFDKSSSSVDYFVCINKHMSEEEGSIELKRFIDHFTPHIHNTTATKLLESIKNIQAGPMPKPDSIQSISSAEETPMEVSYIDQTTSSPQACNGNSQMTEQQSGTNLVANNLDYACGAIDSQEVNGMPVTETDFANRVTTNYSPLTESSLSVCSPDSDENRTMSPQGVRVEYVQNIACVNNLLPSEMVETSLIIEEFNNSPLNSVSDQNSDRDLYGQQVTVFLKHNSPSASLSPLALCDDTSLGSTNLYDGSPISDVYFNEAALPTPPSSGEENSNRSNHRC